MTSQSLSFPGWRPWFALLAAPAAWTVQLLLGFELTPAACSVSRLPLHALDLAALAVDLAALAIGWSEYRRLVGLGETIEGHAVRLMLIVGLAFSALFGLLIVFSSLPPFFLGACGKL
ncbi:MAG TPA: hypothetical protein VHN99_07180 [Deinococcales bacterium]|nr:hypothetical protein [Deinococcales bacterium]